MRADLLLVARGLFDTRARAQAAIAAGGVLAAGRPVRKPSDLLAADVALSAAPAHPYVSRGGLKLVAALAHFRIDPAGCHCLDVGASTGGFTDVLLRGGAASVVAVDTGREQFHASLRRDTRVTLLEGQDIRTLSAGSLARPPDLAVIDVSFIALKLVLPAVAHLLAPAARIVALVKPQFEAGRAAIGKGGIVRDAAVQAACVEAVAETLRGLGFAPHPAIPSPIAGGDGNREFLIAAARPPCDG